MNIYNITSNKAYLKECFELSIKEWGKFNTQEELENKINIKVNKLLSDEDEKIIFVLGLIKEKELIGFISLFKTDGDERTDLTPWYATMYVKKKYRGKGYSQMLNDALLEESKKLGYKKVYLKSDLSNYYEKFGAKYIETLNNGEKLYYIDL